ncbi:hypothetical protein QQZ08_001867 [Neonectria magnoliae]|uniref:Uncharacterized protein n=1 Tax=Neonectria magnoliae TaxID=2732573 RepID=A0ABR1IDK0_9HYPO
MSHVAGAVNRTSTSDNLRNLREDWMLQYLFDANRPWDNLTWKRAKSDSEYESALRQGIKLLTHTADNGYQRTYAEGDDEIDTQTAIVAFPLFPGMNAPWRLDTGVETTQPARPGARKKKRDNAVAGPSEPSSLPCSTPPPAMPTPNITANQLPSRPESDQTSADFSTSPPMLDESGSFSPSPLGNETISTPSAGSLMNTEPHVEQSLYNDPALPTMPSESEEVWTPNWKPDDGIDPSVLNGYYQSLWRQQAATNTPPTLDFDEAVRLYSSLFEDPTNESVEMESDNTMAPQISWESAGSGTSSDIPTNDGQGIGKGKGKARANTEGRKE